MNDPYRPDPQPVDEIWGLIVLFIVDLFLGDIVAGLVAIGVLLRQSRRKP